MQSQCQLVALIPGQIIEFCSESPFLPVLCRALPMFSSSSFSVSGF